MGVPTGLVMALPGWESLMGESRRGDSGVEVSDLGMTHGRWSRLGRFAQSCHGPDVDRVCCVRG